MRGRSSRAPRRAGLVIAAVIAVAAIAGPFVTPALASVALPGLVTDVASTATPVVRGGQCYKKVADPSACRRVLSMIQVGSWIYVGGIISDVYDPGTRQTVRGFHNLFRFNATTHQLDTRWQPQAYRTRTTYRDAGVTGLAASADGSTIYAAGEFTTVASGPGKTGITRNGVAAFDATTGAVISGFNAQVGAGGGSVIVNDVKYVNGTLWLGGKFSHLGKVARKSLASVDPTTGALTTRIPDLRISGQVTSTAGTKVHRIAINLQQTQAVLIGNFTTVGGTTHKEVVVLDLDGTGGVRSVSRWNAPTYLDASQTNCNPKDTWARGVDWSPDGQYFDIAASGGGGFNAWPGLCDAFTRFAFNSAAPDTNATPVLVNFTGYDSLFAVCDTGDYVYLAGHNKYLNAALYTNGTKVRTGGTEAHYGIGVVSVNPSNPSYRYGFGVPTWNDTTETGRGAGWASCLAVGGGPSVGGGVYVGGDAPKVNGNAAIQRLAYFPGP